MGKKGKRASRKASKPRSRVNADAPHAIPTNRVTRERRVRASLAAQIDASDNPGVVPRARASLAAHIAVR